MKTNFIYEENPLENLTQTVEPTEWGEVKYFENAQKGVKFALYHYNDDVDTLYLSNLSIEPETRKKGIGNKILDFVFDYAAKNSFTQVALNVKIGSWVHDWYARRGFTDIEECGDDYKGNIWMMKELA